MHCLMPAQTQNLSRRQIAQSLDAISSLSTSYCPLLIPSSRQLQLFLWSAVFFRPRFQTDEAPLLLQIPQQHRLLTKVWERQTHSLPPVWLRGPGPQQNQGLQQSETGAVYTAAALHTSSNTGRTAGMFWHILTFRGRFILKAAACLFSFRW